PIVRTGGGRRQKTRDLRHGIAQYRWTGARAQYARGQLAGAAIVVNQRASAAIGIDLIQAVVLIDAGRPGNHERPVRKRRRIGRVGTWRDAVARGIGRTHVLLTDFGDTDHRRVPLWSPGVAANATKARCLG